MEALFLFPSAQTVLATPQAMAVLGEPPRPQNLLEARRVGSEAEWTAWLAQVASPAPLASWNDAFSHNSDLARVHNVSQFMQVLYIVARIDSSTADDVLLPGAEAAIRALPCLSTAKRKSKVWVAAQIAPGVSLTVVM